MWGSVEDSGSQIIFYGSKGNCRLNIKMCCGTPLTALVGARIGCCDRTRTFFWESGCAEEKSGSGDGNVMETWLLFLNGSKDNTA